LVRETHISILLFLGERVLKLHKPLRFDFADFSTRSARAEDCRREVELNRRLAPDVYLGVADISLGGETFDHAVVMRRLPAERSLAYLVCSKSEKIWGPEVRRVAGVLAGFHARTDRSAEISARATRDAVATQFEANVAATERFVGSVLEPGSHDGVVRAVRRYLAGRAPLFTARIESGQICDGHGDLQAGDIYCLEDGPRILDCLEFDDSLRSGDVAADVAFLAMDLERLGARSASLGLVRDYEENAGAQLPRSLLHVYIALRAYVRTKVACLRHEQGDPSAAQEAASLLALAADHLDQGRIRLILIGGLPGSGKSTLAVALAASLGAVVVRSDALRRELSGSEMQHPKAAQFREGRYAPTRTQNVYDRLIAAAEVHLAAGDSVVLDASWIDADHRLQAQALAVRGWADLIEFRCVAPAAVTEQRIARRLREGTDLSEATVDVARAMADVESAWPSATAIDTSRVPALALADALRIIGARPESE
jgi:aminoglycoside phosphotransferase family enzyme/predicted kinase